MMKKNQVVILIVFMVVALTRADSSEDKPSLSPLYIYSGGITVGGFKSLNELDELSEAYAKVALTNNFYLNDVVRLFIDIDAFLPDYNFGIDAGVNLYFINTKVKPFVGIGAGVHYFNRENEDFGNNVGLSGKTQFGLLIDVSETLAFKFQVPFHLVGNQKIDQCVGFEVGCIFSSRFKKIKKINYN